MKDLLAAKCKYFHLSLDRRNTVLVNVICKTKMFVRMRLKYVEYPLPGVQTVGATLRGMPVRKGRGGGVGRNAYFSRPTLLIRRPTTGSPGSVIVPQYGSSKIRCVCIG